jgi:hypothetical protein
MVEFQKIWIDQCKAAQNIQEEFGNEKALGYLIGEKLLYFINVADDRPEWAEQLPLFVLEIKRIFQPWEIQEYLDNIKRVGAFGHVCTDEEFEVIEQADPNATDPVYGAQAVITMDRIRTLLMF